MVNKLGENGSVSFEEGEKFAYEIDAIYNIVSAVQDIGIRDLFQLIGKKCINCEWNSWANSQKMNMKLKKHINF